MVTNKLTAFIDTQINNAKFNQQIINISQKLSKIGRLNLIDKLDLEQAKKLDLILQKIKSSKKIGFQSNFGEIEETNLKRIELLKKKSNQRIFNENLKNELKLQKVINKKKEETKKRQEKAGSFGIRENQRLSKIEKNFKEIKRLEIARKKGIISNEKYNSTLKKIQTQLQKTGISARKTALQIKKIRKEATTKFDFGFLSGIFGGLALKTAGTSILRSIIVPYQEATQRQTIFAKSLLKTQISVKRLGLIIGDALNQPFVIGLLESLTNRFNKLGDFFRDNPNLALTILGIAGGMVALGTALFFAGQLFSIGLGVQFLAQNFNILSSSIGTALFGLDAFNKKNKKLSTKTPTKTPTNKGTTGLLAGIIGLESINLLKNTKKGSFFSGLTSFFSKNLIGNITKVISSFFKFTRILAIFNPIGLAISFILASIFGSFGAYFKNENKYTSLRRFFSSLGNTFKSLGNIVISAGAKLFTFLKDFVFFLGDNLLTTLNSAILGFRFFGKLIYRLGNLDFKNISNIGQDILREDEEFAKKQKDLAKKSEEEAKKIQEEKNKKEKEQQQKQHNELLAENSEFFNRINDLNNDFPEPPKIINEDNLNKANVSLEKSKINLSQVKDSFGNVQVEMIKLEQNLRRSEGFNEFKKNATNNLNEIESKLDNIIKKQNQISQFNQTRKTIFTNLV